MTKTATVNLKQGEKKRGRPLNKTMSTESLKMIAKRSSNDMRCMLQICPNSGQNKKVVTGQINLFPLPLQQELRTKWLNRLNLPKTSIGHLCSEHFPERFVKPVDNKLVLLPEAVPIIARTPLTDTSDRECFVVLKRKSVEEMLKEYGCRLTSDSEQITKRKKFDDYLLTGYEYVRKSIQNLPNRRSIKKPNKYLDYELKFENVERTNEPLKRYASEDLKDPENLKRPKQEIPFAPSPKPDRSFEISPTLDNVALPLKQPNTDGRPFSKTIIKLTKDSFENLKKATVVSLKTPIGKIPIVPIHTKLPTAQNKIAIATTEKPNSPDWKLPIKRLVKMDEIPALPNAANKPVNLYSNVKKIVISAKHLESIQKGKVILTPSSFQKRINLTLGTDAKKGILVLPKGNTAVQSAISKLVQPGISKLVQPGTSKPAQVTPDKSGQPGTSKLVQPGTSKPAQVTPDKSGQPGTSKLVQPGTSKLVQPGTSKVVQPETSKVVQPGTSKLVQPGTSKLVQPGISKPAQATPDKSVQPTIELLQPMTTQPIQPMTSKPMQLTKSSPIPSMKSKSVLLKTSTQINPTKSKPVRPAKRKPAQQATSKPAQQAKRKPTQQAKSKPMHPINIKLMAPVKSKPVQPIEPVHPDKSKAVYPAKSKPMHSTKIELVAPAKSEPVHPATGKPVNPATGKPVNPADSQPIQPEKKKPVQSAGNKPVQPTKITPMKLAKKKPAQVIIRKVVHPGQSASAQEICAESKYVKILPKSPNSRETIDTQLTKIGKLPVKGNTSKEKNANLSTVSINLLKDTLDNIKVEVEEPESSCQQSAIESAPTPIEPKIKEPPVNVNLFIKTFSNRELPKQNYNSTKIKLPFAKGKPYGVQKSPATLAHRKPQPVPTALIKAVNNQEKSPHSSTGPRIFPKSFSSGAHIPDPNLLLKNKQNNIESTPALPPSLPKSALSHTVKPHPVHLIQTSFTTPLQNVDSNRVAPNILRKSTNSLQASSSMASKSMPKLYACPVQPPHILDINQIKNLPQNLTINQLPIVERHLPKIKQNKRKDSFNRMRTLKIIQKLKRKVIKQRREKLKPASYIHRRLHNLSPRNMYKPRKPSLKNLILTYRTLQKNKSKIG